MVKFFKGVFPSFFIKIGVIFFVSCAPYALKQNRSKQCVKNYENDFAYIKEVDFKIISGRDTIICTEVRYQCCASALYTRTIMNDKYGKYHRSLIFEDSSVELLIWENINLLSNNKRYSVAAFGAENTIDDIFCSVMVFDKNGEDVLKYDSEEKQEIINFFAQNIRKEGKK
ncbi:hypothetical protein SAMN05421824_1788 [Hyunsoonleella jejuensis]|uniref:Uncharacterized protein n=1 Tax=Hyunsoonleella jejuensis TaxID=419940 RepID=A0A1H9GGF4_9FLAO|nr:hypothetical protein [Hyunsoonleella jejuensis]SEQ48928.1 hypothetical protein SAMN05421824_1788 [Hyunsoonleella jejuensis]